MTCLRSDIEIPTLTACPNCGGEGVVFPAWFGGIYIICKSCHHSTPFAAWTVKDAADDWNLKRTSPHPQ